MMVGEFLNFIFANNITNSFKFQCQVIKIPTITACARSLKEGFP